MKLRGCLLTFVGTAIVSASSFALADDQFTAQYCNVAFSQGISNHYELLTTLQQYQTFQNRFCDANFTSRANIQSSDISAGVSIPVVDTLLNLSGSDDQKNAEFSTAYHNFCQQSAADLNINSRYQTVQTQIDDALVAGWNKCIQDQISGYLQSHGVFLSISPNGNWDSFVARINVRDDLVGRITVKNIAPNEEVSCSYGGHPITFEKTRIDLKAFDLTCRKDFDRQISFSVATSNGLSEQRDVPSGTSKLDELIQQNIGLQGRLSLANSQILQLQQALNSLPKAQKTVEGMYETGAGETKYIGFPAGTFTTTPSVVVSVSHVDAWRTGCRIQPGSITTAGFNVIVEEWSGGPGDAICTWVATGY